MHVYEELTVPWIPRDSYRDRRTRRGLLRVAASYVSRPLTCRGLLRVAASYARTSLGVYEPRGQITAVLDVHSRR
jgi:hypothetical protein